MDVAGYENALLMFAVTGILSAPYVIGFIDPMSYPRLAKIWGSAGVLVAVVTLAYTTGYRDASTLTKEQLDAKLGAADLIMIVASLQSVALFAFDVIYMMGRREKMREKHKPDRPR